MARASRFIPTTYGVYRLYDIYIYLHVQWNPDPNKGHYWDSINLSCLVFYREVVLSSEVLNVWKL